MENFHCTDNIINQMKNVLCDLIEQSEQLTHKVSNCDFGTCNLINKIRGTCVEGKKVIESLNQISTTKESVCR